MAGELIVRAGWALWSKQAGTSSDYSVIASSRESFDKAAFTEIITRFAVGTPDSTATGPGALPWVTLSWVGVDATLHLGIAVTDRTDQVDGVGRPITQTSYYCVPYAPLAAAAAKHKAPVSYAALLTAVAERPLPPRDDGPITLKLEPVSTERLASLIHGFGEHAVASTSALLLSGPVGVIGADGASLRERLDFIDAAASLLPHGYRTKFSAATWSQGGTRQRVRLTFGAYPREDGATVAWRRGADPASIRDAARVYYEQVTRLAGGSAGAISLPDVIGHLGADVEPRRFEQPQDAIDSLNQLDQPFRVLRAVRDRTGASLADLRQVFMHGRARELPAEADRAALLAELADRGDAGDWPQLRQEISTLRGADDGVRILAAFGRRMLWAAVPPDAGLTRACLRLASDLGAEDAVLAEFIRLPDKAADLTAGLRESAGLLADTVLLPRPGGRDYQRTRDLLASDPRTAAEYVAALARGGRSVSLLRWLDPQGTSVFSRTFGAVLGSDERRVSEPDLAALGDAGAGCVRLLLQVASDCRHLDKVLPGLTNWLAGHSELGKGEQDYWAKHLAVLETRDPRSQAWLDTALLMLGGLPSRLPPSQRKAAADYGTDMAGIWTGLSRTYPRFDAEACARSLARYFGERPWAATAEQALAVTELARRLSQFDPRRVLETTVAATLAATPGARGWKFAQEWLALAAASGPQAVRERLLDSLAAAPPGAGPGHLAGLCVSACGEGIDPAMALGLLAKSGALTGAAQAGQLLSALQRQFEAAGIDEETMQAWLFPCAELIAGGEFGAELGRELRPLVSDWVRRDLWLELRLLSIFAEDARERQYVWTEAEREDLAAIAGEIESMLRKARKFPRQKKLRIPFGGAGSEESTPGGAPGVAAEVNYDDPGAASGPTREWAAGTEDTVTMPGRPR